MAESDDELDLIAIGRVGIDLYGEQVGGRLEDVTSFARYVGGSPGNTAIGAARLGLRSALCSRVGADHFGRFIREQLQREGVSVAGLHDDPDRLTALVILGIRDRERFPLIFYRENCADMALDVGELDEDWLRSAGAVLIGGTHLSRPNVFAVSRRAAELARAAGRRVVFDVDYRPVLWGLAGRDRGEDRFVADPEVTARLQAILPLCDLIVGTEEEMHILGGSTDTVAALRAIRERSGALLVCKRGPQGCVAFPGDVPASLDEGVVGAGFAVEVYNVLGAGDAFMAGFLRGWLRGEALATCCSWGNACGAIVVSRHGCAPAMPTWPELQDFLARYGGAPAGTAPRRLRDDRALEHLHRVTTRAGCWDQLTVLAMDHRSQFEALAARLGVGADRIEGFKALSLRAVHRFAGGDGRVGLLLDGRYGRRGLEDAADYPYWIGRPIEVPGSCPVAFECGPDVGVELRTWPANHVVKCLVFHHPDDPQDLRERQERQLLRLQHAALGTGHELLVEIIASRERPVDAGTVPAVMQRFYDLGMRPDWWKLEPNGDPQAWQAVQRTIQDNDPHCRGVVLLGLAASPEELIAGFPAAAATPVVRGFAVGRTIWADTAEAWLAGHIGDDEAVAQLAGRFGELVQAWRAARADAESRNAA
ncbi:bifunctional 5-dehydro-2-deoxygluconokinase/5-dehydro-2-deoxyphosphogluconate aldolase [Arenimonas composti]|uniref:5-dehydro-2-deoxygluconokinase n=1 Tax=Arenimonas composti TR7-09 = DSM 18010 TaxID=1121013 RepID=A0A091BA09_9GAMM|nr:5-dehydro-2-deoxygluconokinase [Arenimonas composti]KFN49458.1 hypothetical protein P873_10825 [Arenimonas composti TR7-09 = DSM 18010]